jgi:ABC-2 type transport system ATP-binding protein
VFAEGQQPEAGGAIAVRGLGKRYGATVALENVDLHVGPGQLRGLLGPNGAGKTTLLRLIFGLAKPDSGEVSITGRLAGFAEDPTFYPYLSGRRNLQMLASLDDVEPDEVAQALERVGLTRRAGDRVAGYSTGMRQRLGIAAALLRSSTALALDEPTSGLDPAGIRDTSALLRELAADGVAVLVSSHLIGELEEICDSYTILLDGKVIWDGSADAVTEEPRRASPLQDLYFGLTS